MFIRKLSSLIVPVALALALSPIAVSAARIEVQVDGLQMVADGSAQEVCDLTASGNGQTCAFSSAPLAPETLLPVGGSEVQVAGVQIAADGSVQFVCSFQINGLKQTCYVG